VEQVKHLCKETKESEMLEASKYLEIVKKRGIWKKGLERVYRLIRKEDILLKAYINLCPNKGVNTPGISKDDTIDGMSLKKIKEISEELRTGEYKFKPVKRVYIKKRDGKQRPLGIPGWSEKIVQEATRIILEEYYEPNFSDSSHGFRRNRGCHTAIKRIADKGWTGVKWFIEGDIKQCFDNINHDKLIEILSKDIRDSRFLKLIRKMLEAGYVEDWKLQPNYSGTVQGGVISPLLSNIYLNELDKFIEERLIPRYSKGKRRKKNKAYNRLYKELKLVRREKGTGYKERAIEIRKLLRKLPSLDTKDPDFRRLKYVRYADDFLLGFTGSKKEAIEIKEEIDNFLRNELKMELSMEKTLITSASKEKARFLNYEISARNVNSKITRGINGVKKRSLNNIIQLRMPKDILNKWLTKYTRGNKPIHRSELINSSDYEVIMKYNLELRGLYNYYILSQNVSGLHKLKYYMKCSLIKTLANKHKTGCNKILKRYSNGKAIRIIVPRENKKSLIATFGDIELKRKRNYYTNHQEDKYKTVYQGRSELLKRLLVNKCEICGEEDNIEVHHIKKISDLKRRYEGKKNIPKWKEIMIARNRNTLIVCKNCHNLIHSGKYDGTKLTRV